MNEQKRDWQRGEKRREEGERVETAYLPGAFWELNLAGEISSVCSK